MRAIVLAAGAGQRVRPLTLNRPKPMLPVANKPILEHILAALHVAEVTDVTIVVGHKAEAIQTHVQDGGRFGVRVRYAHQPSRKGSIDSFVRGAALKGSDDLLVVPGDNYLGRDVLKRFLAAAGDRDALLYTRSREPERYGVVELNDDFVASVSEKPAVPGASTVSTGIVKLKARRAAKAKAHLGNPESGLTDFYNVLANEKERLVGIQLEGPWFDVDRPENLLGATAVGLSEEEGEVLGTVEPGANLVGPVRIGKGSRVRSGSYLVGPLVVGEGVEIGPHTVVYGPTAIGDNATIGPFTELLECVVMDDTRIASGCTLHHVVLDRGVVLAPRVHADKAHAVHGASFGAIVGEGTVLGNQVSLEPGAVIGQDVRVAPSKRVGRLPDGARVV